MKHLKMLGLAAVMAMALMALFGAGSASATTTTLCKVTPVNGTCAGNQYPEKTVIFSHLSTGTKAVLNAGFATIECSQSTVKIEGEAGQVTATTLGGNVTELTFSSCNCEVTVLTKGTIDLTRIAGTHNGTLTSTGTRVRVNCFGAVCVYGEGHLGEIVGGAAPVFHAKATNLKLIEGGFLCGNPASWTATYSVTSPVPLYVGS